MILVSFNYCLSTSVTFFQNLYNDLKSNVVISFLLGAPANMALPGPYVKWRLMNAYQDHVRTMELAWIS